MQNRTVTLIIATERAINLLWMPLAGRLLLARTIDVFETSPLIHTIILVVCADRVADATHLCKHEHWQKISIASATSSHWHDLVRAGLDRLTKIAATHQWIVIHDGACPLITPTLLEAGLQAAQKHRTVTAAVPIKDTIKQVQQGVIQKTLDRSQLWTVQTPYIFLSSLLYQGYRTLTAQETSADDTSLFELGQQITIFPGSYTNIKIATHEDLLLAEALLTGDIR